MKVIDYMAHVVESVPSDALFVAGIIDSSRALVALNQTDRSLVGFNMGLATAVGLGVASALPHRRVCILDSDGGVLLNSTSLTDLANEAPANAIVVIDDNETALGMSTHTARRADIAAMARGAGVENTCTVRNIDEFRDEFGKALNRGALSYIVAKTEPGSFQVASGTGRLNFQENKFRFVRHVEKTEGISIMRPFGGRM